MRGKCYFCEIGNVKPGTATMPMHRDAMVVVVKNVPVDVCANCGEEYISHEIGIQLDAIFDDAENAGIEILVRKYPVKPSPPKPRVREAPTPASASQSAAQPVPAGD